MRTVKNGKGGTLECQPIKYSSLQLIFIGVSSNHLYDHTEQHKIRI